MSSVRARVGERLAAARASGDRAPLLRPEAAADALTLLREITPSPDGDVDAEALALVCWTFWFRCQGATGQEAQRESGLAASILGFLRRRAPAGIALPELAAPADPLWEARFAFVVAAQHAQFVLNSPDPTAPAHLASLDRALAWSRAANRGAAGDEVGFIDTRLQLMALLDRRFELAADPDSLSGAARAALAVRDRLRPQDPVQAGAMGAALEVIVRAALLVGDPSLEDVDRLIATTPGEVVTQATTAMLGSLRELHAECTWPGALDAKAGAAIAGDGIRTRHAGVLACAIRRLRAALAVLPGDHPEYTGVRQALGLALVTFGNERDDAAAADEGAALLARGGPRPGMPGLPAAVELGAIAVDITIALNAEGARESVTDERLHLYRAALDRLPAGWPDRHTYVAVLAAATGTRALALQETQPERAAELTARARALAGEADATAPADFPLRLPLRLGKFDRALRIATLTIPWAELAASVRDGLPDGPGVTAITSAFESLAEAAAAPAAAGLVTALGSLHLDGPEHLDSDIAQLRALLARAKDDDLRRVLTEMLSSLLAASGGDRAGSPPPPGFDDSSLSGEARHYVHQLLALAGPETAAAAPDEAKGMGLLREALVSAAILVGDQDLTQGAHAKELMRQLQELLDQGKPGGAEQIRPLIEFLTAFLEQVPESLEAGSQGRTAEVQGELVARLRGQIDALPADHPIVNRLEAILANLLVGEAQSVRGTDPGRAAELLAEADALVERVGAVIPEAIPDVLRGNLEHTRAIVEGSEEPPPHPLEPPWPSGETIDRTLEEAGYSEEAVHAMLRDPQIPVWSRAISGFGAAFAAMAAALEGGADLRRIGQCMAFAEEAADLLATVTDRGSDQLSAEHALAVYASDLPRLFVAAVLSTAHLLQRAGRGPAAATATGPLVDRATALAERVRGLLLARQLESHTDLRDLRSAHPELAHRFEDLTGQLAAEPEALARLRPEDDQPSSGGGAWARTVKRRISRDLDTLLDQIRGEDGFAGFLRPLSAEQLRELAGDGPVVFINHPPHYPQADAFEGSPYALIVTPQAITSLRLDVAPAGVTEAARNLRDAIDVINARGQDRPSPAKLRAAGDVLRETLSWTWHSVVRPVLATAGFSDATPAGATWPRIWWIPTGPFNALPLHAAQCTLPDCTQGDCGAALDAVVSSYVPGFKTLAHARSQSAGLPPDTGDALLVAANDDDLPGARAAAEYAAERLGAAGPLVGGAATRNAVESSLTDATWVHFGCHATSDPAQPSGGMLHLPSGEPLPVLQLCRIRPGAARQAFLAACGTARTSERLADESIHLTSAFLIAGFPEAVGTLWEVSSTETEYVTREFYRRVTGENADTPASALHYTIRKIRNDHPDNPHTWAAYIHAGI